MLPFCNYLNHQLLAWLPHNQFAPCFLPLPSHSSKACSDLMYEHWSSFPPPLPASQARHLGQVRRQPLTLRPLHNCISSPSVSPPPLPGQEMGSSVIPQAEAVLAGGSGICTGSPATFHPHSWAGTPILLQVLLLTSPGTQQAASQLCTSADKVLACSSVISIPSRLKNHIGLQCHGMPKGEFMGKWKFKPLLQPGHPTDLAAPSPTVSPALTELYHLKAT